MTPPEPDFSQYAILVFCVGLFAVLGAVASVSAIYKNIVLARAAKNPTRTPPIEEEAAKTYATKTELSSIRCEFSERCRINHERIDKTFIEVFSVLRAQQSEIIDKLGEVSQWQLGVERQIGTIEGKIGNES